jgi:acyl-CoA dehydrogenase
MSMQVNEDEQQMLQDLAAKFVDRELMKLEPLILAREASGGKYALTEEEEAPLLAKCHELGLIALDVPESLGGANLPVTVLMRVEEELARTLVPFTFPPDSPNLHMMLAVANDYQRERYLKPYAEGRAKSAIAISEPGAGGDPAGMITRAVKDGTDWVINGRKIWVGRVPSATRPASSSSARSRCSAAVVPTNWCSRIAACRKPRCSANSAAATSRCNSG